MTTRNAQDSGHVNGSEALENSDPKSEAAWPEPKPLGSRLSPVELFAPEMLPDALLTWVLDVQELMHVPIDLVAVSAVILLAAATNRRARIQPKAIDTSWQEVLNLWGAIIAPPSVKKTAVMGRILKPLRNVEAGWREQDQQAFAEYAEELKEAKKEKTDLPPKPRMRGLIVNDATPEALHEALRDNPAGLTSIHDELTGWLGNLLKAGREAERGFYLACWGGDTPYQVKRIRRGTIDAPAMCLSMLGGIQPKRLASYLAGEGGVPLSDDGLLQRFQVAVWPDQQKSYRYVDRLPNKRAEWRVEQIVEMVTELDPDSPLVMKFAPDAQQIFVEWFTKLETRLLSEDMTPLLAQYLGKYRSLMPILAALFELCDWADEIAPPISPLAPSVSFVGCRDVSRVNAERAIRWCRYLESHARRICNLMDSDEQVAIQLAVKLRASEFEDGFTPRMVVQKNWHGLGSTLNVKSACRFLLLADWLREVEKRPGSEGGRPSTSYQVNPRIKDLELDDLILLP